MTKSTPNSPSNRLPKALLTVCLALVPLAKFLRADEAANFNPRDTYGVIVGVLEWSDPSLSPFTKADRQDRVLYQTFRRRGVPKQNLLLLLDEAATRDAVLAALKEQAAAAEPDATFIFYYAGHGVRTSEDAYLANVDLRVSTPDDTGLSVDDVAETLIEHFRGRRVLLFADCCHSGSLEAAVERLAEHQIAAACVTSVFPAGVSTNNWTFTQTLIDVFRGRSLGDRNADGAVTFDELNREVADAMRHFENQRCGFANRGWADECRLAEVQMPTETDPRIGEYVEARDAGEWVRGRVVGTRKNTVLVQLQRYSDRPVLRVTSEELRPPREDGDVGSPPPSAPAEAALLAPQTKVLVQRGDRMRPATVLECDAEHCRVRLDELDEAEESVPWEQITKLETEWEPYTVLVEWGGNWWPANIQEQNSDRHHVHFVGWSNDWNEWVDASRLRKLPDEDP